MGIDFMWHTHMDLPEYYKQDSKKYAGTFLEHNDTITDALLKKNFMYPLN